MAFAWIPRGPSPLTRRRSAATFARKGPAASCGASAAHAEVRVGRPHGHLRRNWTGICWKVHRSNVLYDFPFEFLGERAPSPKSQGSTFDLERHLERHRERHLERQRTSASRTASAMFRSMINLPAAVGRRSRARRWPCEGDRGSSRLPGVVGARCRVSEGRRKN